MQKASVSPSKKKPWPYIFFINFFESNEIESVNPCVSNILRARETSLKPFRGQKIWITIVRWKNLVWVTIGRNGDPMNLSSIFSGQTEQNRNNTGVSSILRAREMSLKPFRDKKIRITLVRCKWRVWVTVGRNRDHTSYQFSRVKRNRIETTPLFLIL